MTLTYDYDADGNRTSMDDSLGGLVSYTYNPRDELTNETLSGTDISAMAVANAYDNAGNMTGQTRYSNLAETTVVASTAYTYDNAEANDRESRIRTRRHDAGLVRLHVQRRRPGDARKPEPGIPDRHGHTRLHLHE